MLEKMRSSQKGKESRENKRRMKKERERLTAVAGFPKLPVGVYSDCLVVCSLKHVPELKRLT